MEPGVAPRYLVWAVSADTMKPSFLFEGSGGGRFGAFKFDVLRFRVLRFERF